MTFQELPDDWPARSLADPVLAADLVDLVVTDKDRAEGALAFLLCRPEGSLAQPLVLNELDGDPVAAFTRMATIIVGLPGTPGFVLAIARARGPVTDQDRELHQHALEVCRELGLVLWGTYLATHLGVTHLPVALGLEPRRGAA